MGVNFFDTADMYGTGHSEEILGRAISGRRDEVVNATKFGCVINEDTRQWIDNDGSPEYMRKALEASLRRLDTDYIDLYQFHYWGYPAEEAEPVRDALEEAVKEGKIRGYGWIAGVEPPIEHNSKDVFIYRKINRYFSNQRIGHFAFLSWESVL